MFGNRMQTSAIPERVYALCREVASRPMDENSLKLLLEPKNLGGKTPYFGIVRTAAEQLQLINTKENTISLAVDKDVVKSMDNMRHYINSHTIDDDIMDALEAKDFSQNRLIAAVKAEVCHE
mgnify:CR=1 FL=1